MIVSCFYCMRKGHSARFCKVRKVFVPRGILKWVPKNLKGSCDQINSYGPKFVRGPNLGAWSYSFVGYLKEFIILEVENQGWKRIFVLDFLLQILFVVWLLECHVHFFNHVYNYLTLKFPLKNKSFLLKWCFPTHELWMISLDVFKYKITHLRKGSLCISILILLCQ